MSRPRAALFDVDRTLVRRETASLFVRYQMERGEAGLLDLLRVTGWVAQYTLGVVDADRVAERIFSRLRGVREADLNADGEAYFDRYVVPHVAERGRLAVARHASAVDVCVIVTGALACTTRPLARLLGIEHVVATELEVDVDGRFTGRHTPPLCLGRGKLSRTEAIAERLGFRVDEATFYTDSITDLPLLERVREPVAVNPDLRLRRQARRRGIRVERW